MTNPFDAATEAMIECYDRNVEYFKTAGYIVYKEHEGLSTFYAKHKRDVPRPNYPVPAILQCQWCGSATDVCDYNGDGYWCPSLCFQLN